jgi:chromosome segregation ATPase
LGPSTTHRVIAERAVARKKRLREKAEELESLRATITILKEKLATEEHALKGLEQKFDVQKANLSVAQETIEEDNNAACENCSSAKRARLAARVQNGL